MSEEQKNKYDRKTADRDFLRALSPEQLAAIDGLKLAPEAIPDEVRPDILAMTPEQVASHLNIGLKLKRARKVGGRIEMIVGALKIATLIAAGWVAALLGQTWLSDWASYLGSFTYTAFGLATLLILDAGLPQFNLYEILKKPVHALVFTGYIVLLIGFGSISGAGSITLNSGAGIKPAEPQQEQQMDPRADSLAAAAQRQRDILEGRSPKWREGNQPKAQPQGNSDSDSEF